MIVKRFSLKRGITFSILVVVILFMPAFGNTRGLSISYNLSLAHPENHIFDVIIQIENPSKKWLRLTLPAWTPGTYTLQNHARNLFQLKAVAKDSTRLPVEREDFDTWKVRVGKHRTIWVHYKILGLLRDDATCFLDSSRAYVNGASVFMYVNGEKNRPAALTIRHMPPGWDVATGLEATSDSHHFRAKNYDELIDCPILMGHLDWFSFQVAGIPHELAVWNLKNSNFPAARVVKIFKGFVQQTYQMFGELDYPRYVFLIQLDGTFDALEHRNSCTLSFYPYKFDDPQQFDDFTWVGFHEYFHNFNVKRIRPDILGPFDYKHPATTKRLWISEGLTDYFPDLLFQRDGFWSKARFYRQLSDEITLLQTLPARHWMSLESASIQTWHLSDNKCNLEISYYNKGELVGWMLDLELLRRTGGKHNLADVMRYLFRHYYKRGVGFSEKMGIQRDVETVAGGSFQAFFDRYVRGTAEIPYQEFLKTVGLKLVTQPDTLPFTGIQTFPRKAISRIYATARKLHNSLNRVTNVVMGSPAWKAGVSKGDVILAVDGQRVRDGFWKTLIEQKSVGDTVRFLLEHNGRVVSKCIRLAQSPFVTYTVRDDPTATPKQKHLREIWLKGKKI
jgi:predicted metalloprotease with PDZ domain